MEAIDWSALKENCAGDDSLVNEVLDLFRKEAPALLSDVKAATARGDAQAVKRTAHRLKGALVSLAAMPSVAAARELEHMGNANDLARVAEAFTTLEVEMGRLMTVLGATARAA